MSQQADAFARQPQIPAELRPKAGKQVGVEARSAGEAGGDDEVLKLVQRVFLFPSERKAPGVVAFCGANRGVGCSWVCARAAQSLVEQAAGSVCLVDANVRNPALHREFEMKRTPGFVDFIESSRPVSDFARRIHGGNLWLVTAGSGENNGNRFLNTQRLRARFSDLRAQFAYVLVDTPAMDSSADALLLSQLADGIVFVLGSNSTRREAARNAKLSLEAAQIPMLGAVLNRRTYPIPGAIYRNI